jgi:EAL domain-containing protein (putative c-di-GMP-specific phosphodiesterase class I)
MFAIEPHFQPIVDLLTGDVLGYELLSRGSGSLRSPMALFEHARRCGSTWELERACRLAALRSIADLDEATRSRHLFFLNVSPDALENPRFVAGFTLNTVERYGLRQDRIVIEITERVSIGDYARFEAAIRHYADQGFRIAVDDFGSGHSGLVTLISSRPHFLKLDMAVTRGVHRDAYKQMIVKSMVALAENIGATLVAEGVESWDELESLVSYGVRYAQGFLLGRPASAPVALAEQLRLQLTRASIPIAV